MPSASSVPVDLSLEPIASYRDEISGTWRGTRTDAVWNYASSFEATLAGTIEGDGVSVGGDCDGSIGQVSAERVTPAPNPVSRSP